MPVCWCGDGMNATAARSQPTPQEHVPSPSLLQHPPPAPVCSSAPPPPAAPWQAAVAVPSDQLFPWCGVESVQEGGQAWSSHEAAVAVPSDQLFPWCGVEGFRSASGLGALTCMHAPGLEPASASAGVIGQDGRPRQACFVQG
eukprot:363758-Chlamydomonas_euryale.AAC.5